MNLEWLTTFRKVVDTRSYTRAAEQLLISQPAVSQQLRRLEGFFGCRLFDRTGRDIQLTPAGRRVYQLALHLEEDLDNARQDLHAIALSFRDLVTFAGGPTPLMHLLVPALKTFTHLYPNATVRLLSGTTETILQRLGSGEVDIGLLQDTFILDPNLTIAGTFTDEFVAVCAPEHRAASKRLLPFDLAEERVAIIRFGTESRRMLEDWFGQRGVFLTNMLELATYTDIRAAAIGNLAVGFLSRYSVEEDLDQGRLVLVDIEGFHLARPLFLVHRQPLGAAAETLINLVLNVFHKLQPSETTGRVEHVRSRVAV